MFKLVACVMVVGVVCSSCESASSNNKTKLYLLGLFPMTGAWAGGEALLLASQLAVRDINANRGVLPGFELVLLPKDTACDGGKATDAMYRELYNRSTTKMMILGGGCSTATEPTAQASHHWNLIQISFTSTSPKLSQRETYPRFFRLISTLSMHNIFKIALFREFNWRKVATLHESVSLFTLSMADFHMDASKEGIEILGAESFVDNPITQVGNIKQLGARIIIGGFYSNMARRVFCAAYHHQLYGPKYVWILPGWLEKNWWREPDDSIDCTVEQMDEATANYFGIDIDTLPTDNNRRPSLAGLTTSEFLKNFGAIYESSDPESLVGYLDTSLSYDTVWTAALALQEAQKQLLELEPPRALSDFMYDNVTADILFHIISSLTFEGVSGPVTFTSSGDRLGLYVLRQLQDGEIVSTGMMDPTNGSGYDIVWNGYQSVQWQGGSPPIDFRIEREIRQTIQPSLFTTGVVFAVAGISLACALLAFNIRFRKLRVIKMSSPNINNLMLIGGILAYLSIIFLGIDTAMVSTETFLWMCKAKTWCLSVGFSMAFGSMFSKTWRVHKIFTNKTARKMAVKDFRLFSFVASLILVDVLLVVLWETFDPLQAKEKHGLEQVDDENDDIIYTPVRIMCESAHQIYWIGSFYVIDGLLLVFGAFLAWETRTVSIQALNDSKFIGVCIYNMLIFSVIGAPISFVLEDRNALYALVAGLIWLATTLTLCVIFIPKIKLRNSIIPAHNRNNTMISTNTLTQDRQIRNLVDTQKDELQLLRQEILQLKMVNRKLSSGRKHQELGDPNPTDDTL
ncbi:gamma-aminobutyric acid type B receptor subunit 1-like [Asterias amurensis]|uniref:gamma-aminobutyric acid type B receptor subunit 1-like n=1 Tax=Asterias amurensis TaxID=7602 RepID=UPI003AB8D388